MFIQNLWLPHVPAESSLVFSLSFSHPESTSSGLNHLKWRVATEQDSHQFCSGSPRNKWGIRGIKKKPNSHLRALLGAEPYFCTHTQHDTKNFIAMTPEGRKENSITPNHCADELTLLSETDRKPIKFPTFAPLFSFLQNWCQAKHCAALPVSRKASVLSTIYKIQPHHVLSHNTFHSVM